MEEGRCLKSGELVKPDCKVNKLHGALCVRIWGHPLKRHWRDSIGYWDIGQTGIIIEIWETKIKEGNSETFTGYKYKIMGPKGIIGWVDQQNILPLEEK